MDGLYSVQPANSSDFSRIYEKALENKILVLQPVASGISFKSRDTHAKISIVSDDEKGYLPVSHLIISFSHFIFQRNELIVDHYCEVKGSSIAPIAVSVCEECQCRCGIFRLHTT